MLYLERRAGRHCFRCSQFSGLPPQPPLSQNLEGVKKRSTKQQATHTLATTKPSSHIISSIRLRLRPPPPPLHTFPFLSFPFIFLNNVVAREPLPPLSLRPITLSTTYAAMNPPGIHRPYTPPGMPPQSSRRQPSRLSIGTVCSSNINRSMEAHVVMQNAGENLGRVELFISVLITLKISTSTHSADISRSFRRQKHLLLVVGHIRARW